MGMGMQRATWVERGEMGKGAARLSMVVVYGMITCMVMYVAWVVICGVVVCMVICMAWFAKCGMWYGSALCVYTMYTEYFCLALGGVVVSSCSEAWENVWVTRRSRRGLLQICIVHLK